MLFFITDLWLLSFDESTIYPFMILRNGREMVPEFISVLESFSNEPGGFGTFFRHVVVSDQPSTGRDAVAGSPSSSRIATRMLTCGHGTCIPTAVTEVVQAGSPQSIEP